MNNIRVLYKIVAIAMVSIVAMLCVGWLGFHYLSKANTDMDVMYSQSMQSVRKLSEERVIRRKIQVDVLQGMVDPQQAAKAETSLAEDCTSYEKNWAEYMQITSKDGVVGENEKSVEGLWKEYKTVYQKVLALAKEGKAEEARVLYEGQGDKAFNALRDVTSALQNKADQEALNVYNSNDDNQEAAIRLILIIAVAALLLIIGANTMLVRAIVGPLNQMVAVCSKLRDGDFRDAPRQIHREDEFGRMANVLADMRTNLNKLMKQINSSVDQIASSSEELTASSAQSANAATQVAESVTSAAGSVEQQGVSVDDSAAAVQKVTASVEKITKETGKASNNAAAAAQQAEEGSKAIDSSVAQIQSVEKTVTATAEIVDKLGARSQEIGQIIGTISDIADQTNLLALNAAIEAARAGEAGRGFSVVADSIRKLAEQSQQAAQQIAELIEAIQTDTSSAVDSMQQGRTAVVQGTHSVEGLHGVFAQITEHVAGVSRQVGRTAEAVRVVDADSERISEAVGRIDAHSKKVAEEMQSVSAATQEQSASAEEIASASDALARLAQELQLSMQKFKF